MNYSGKVEKTGKSIDNVWEYSFNKLTLHLDC